MRVGFALIAALLLPLEAAAWDLEASRDPARYLGMLKLGVASAGTALLAWGLVLRLLERPGSARRLREALLIALGALAALCWFNFFQFHQGVYLHTAEIFHHYVGAKYFRELSYSRLYDCTVVADYSSGFDFPADKRPVRRLGSNRVDWATEVLADPEACTGHFSPQRWRSFRRDVGWFRARFHPRRWASITTDRGFNSTPVWNIAASSLANTGPPTPARILTLALLDPLLLLIMWGFVAWAFGWRTLCVALIYWGTNYPALFGWTGGAFLRQDWLATAVIGLCLLRREKFATGGLVLTLSVLLRMTPAILIAGLALKVLGLAWREHSLTLRAPHRRFAAGCVTALAIALPLSALVSGGGAWADFARNTQVDLGTPSGNFMGWKTVASYEHETRMKATRDRRLIDLNAPWQQARRDAFQRRQPWFWAGVLGFLAVLLPAVRRNDDWTAAVLGVGLMVVCVQIPSYYYALLLAYAFLWQRSEAIGVGLCALSAASWLIAGAFSGRDEIFNWVSLASVLFVLFTTLLAWRSASVAEEARASAVGNRASRAEPR
jgi:hypothetical protein